MNVSVTEILDDGAIWDGEDWIPQTVDLTSLTEQYANLDDEVRWSNQQLKFRLNFNEILKFNRPAVRSRPESCLPCSTTASMKYGWKTARSTWKTD